MSKTTTPERCQVQQRQVVVLRVYQEAGGIGDDEAAQVLVRVACSHARSCTDLHRCPLREE